MEELLKQNGFDCCKEMYLYIKFIDQDENSMSNTTIEIDTPEKFELFKQILK